ncbi:MAG: thiamine pyrophosphate-dependent dehydrogenase E1 component subunit alpha [Chloroflexota bacterium]|nr:thiamine pyrophosphate-dependent dehydrogenase E1 component subunit alpha [Chloroflexota bacterium]
MDAETLKYFYYQMLRIRRVEERIAALYPEQEMRCPVHLCIGQEAVAVGVCASLNNMDYVLSNHRSHGHYLAKGGDLKAMIAELYGKATGCCRGKGGSMHLIDLGTGFLGAAPIVGSTIAIALGAALASVMRGEDRVTVAFLGDGATEEGVFHESLNFAVLKNLPIVFVCENNMYSVYSPLAVRQPDSREIFELAKGHGMESHQGDGNTVTEVYEIAERSVSKARRGDGPTFLEFRTYRWREHCGPYYDNNLGYRPESEFMEWKNRCPVDLMRNRLLAENGLSYQDFEEMEHQLEVELEEAIVYAKMSLFPESQFLMDHVYAPSNLCEDSVS